MRCSSIIISRRRMARLTTCRVMPAHWTTRPTLRSASTGRGPSACRVGRRTASLTRKSILQRSPKFSWDLPERHGSFLKLQMRRIGEGMPLPTQCPDDRLCRALRFPSVKLSWPDLNLAKLNEEDAMATVTTTATGSLTPAQQAAREFWRQAGADGMPPFYVMSQYYAQLSANSDNLPAVTAALEQLLTGLGYATDVDTIFSELAAGQAEELGYWAGRYCLFDSDGNRFDLVVGRNSATLTVPPALIDVTKLPAGTDMASVTALSGASFSDSVLQLANAQF